MEKLNKKNIEDIFALTPMQEGMLFHYLKDPESDIYFEQLSLEIAGEIDYHLFEKAWNFVIEINEMLRAVFRWEKIENPLQIILKKHQLQPKYYDLSGKKSSEKKTRVENIKDEDRKEKFDLREVPFRVTLCRIEAEKYEMIISNHHILYDGWSNGIILKEFFTIYHDLVHKRILQQPIKSKFKEFVTWLNKQDKKEQEKFWKDYLKGFEEPSELAVKIKRTRTRTGEINNWGNLRISIKKDTREQIEAFIHRWKITMATLLYGTWGLLLQRYNNTNSVIFGTTISGRSAKIEGIENIVGLFINTLPLRVEGDSNERTIDMLKRINKTLQARAAYESTPLVRIREYSECQLSPHGSLFDSIVVIENYPLDKHLQEQERTGELSINSYSTFEKTNYDLTVTVSFTPGKMDIRFFYKKERFEKDAIKNLVIHFVNILNDILLDPTKKLHEIDILSTEERDRLLVELNRTRIDYPAGKTIHQLFEEQVERTPDYTAVIVPKSLHHQEPKESIFLTYQLLNQKANQVAFLLEEKGILVDDIVGIMVGRSGEMIICILGILKAGGAYLPIDPDHPEERKKYMLSDSSANILVTINKLAKEAETVILDVRNKPACSLSGKPPNCNLQPATSMAYITYTSGSTGTPKGVMVKHASVVNILLTLQHLFPLTSRDTYLLKTSYLFDVSVTELFGWFLEGGRLGVLEPGGEKDPITLLDTIERERVTHINFVPSMFRFFVETLSRENITKLSTLIYIFLAGEVLLPGLVQKFRSFNTTIVLENLYGPTEATVYASGFSLSQWSEKNPVSIGKPLANFQLYILDRNVQVLPIGIPGELYIGGEGLARGYLNRSELTAEKFLRAVISHSSLVISSFLKPNDPSARLFPITPSPQYPIYRTGDLARWFPDGNIEFLGRIDHQTKIRGFRIELGEIESQLLNHNQIKEVTVLAKKDKYEERFLCTYFVSNIEITGTELRTFLSTKLPDYMIPAYFVRLEEIPLTVTGKIDRKSLPEPDITSTKEYIAPRNQREEDLVEIWSDVLGVEKKKIGINDNFFDLGGHSLKSVLLMSQIHKKFDIEIPLSQLFRSPTIRELAHFMLKAEKSGYSLIEPVEEKEYYMLSSAQKRLYFLQQMDNAAVAYNMPFQWTLEGAVDKNRLEDTFRKLIQRHESLRTSFHMVNEVPVQLVYDEVEFEIEYDQSLVIGHWSLVNCQCRGEVPSPIKVEKIIRNFIRPFDLSQSPLLRVGLIKLQHTPTALRSHSQRAYTSQGVKEDKYLLMVDMHHIISDGISTEILVKDFPALYHGEKLPEMRLQYKDYAQWQNREKGSDRIQKQVHYWRKEFESEIPILYLPTDYTRHAVQRFEGNSIHFQIEKIHTDALKSLALGEGLTLYMVLLAIFNVFLSKLSNQEDIVIGSPVAGRSHVGLEFIMGMFVNTLALRHYPAGDKRFIEFLREVKEKTLLAFENQDYPHEDLVERTVTNRDSSRNPLFDTAFVLQDFHNPQLEIAGIKLKPCAYEHRTSKFDLTLIAIETGETLSFIFEYSTKLFRKETIQRYSKYLKKIIRNVLEDRKQKIADIEIILEEEKNLILYDFNDTKSGYPKNESLHQLFEEQAERNPDHLALVGEIPNFKSQIPDKEESYGQIFYVSGRNISITYRELNERSDGMASIIIEKEALKGNIVGIMVERSVEMVIGILGILKAGKAYLPINPKNPGKRSEYMLNDSGVKILVTDGSVNKVSGWEGEIIHTPTASFPPLSREDRVCPNSQFAYVIYTSGSTGEPKGVIITHSNLSPLLHWGYRQLGFSLTDRVVQNLSYYFDWSVWEIFITLTSGASLYIVPEEVRLNPGDYIDFIVSNNITVLHVTPTQYRYLVNNEKKLKTLRYLFIGAETLSFDLVQRSFESVDKQCRVFNMYGPTECTIISAVLEINRAGYYEYKSLSSVPIGKPSDNTQLFILDKYLNLCPVNIPGELYIGGDGVAPGYLNNLELTAEKFVEKMTSAGERRRCINKKLLWGGQGDSFLEKSPPGHRRQRLYKSGDLSRWLGDGTLEFLGRIDHQVKIRGFRIELGEIENRLLAHKNIKEAVVIDREQGGEPHLCAYIVPQEVFSEAGTISRELREYLSQELPDHMIPFWFVQVNVLPLGPTGKIDRKSLPEPGNTRAGKEFVPPKNAIENKLVEIWEIVLKTGPIGIYDNFFDVGGHSLKAVQLVSKIQEAFAVEIRIRELFQFPTIAELYSLIHKRRVTPFSVIEPQPQRPYYELSYSQKRLWFILKQEPNSGSFNIPTKITLYDAVDESIIRMVLKSLMNRHESLRTSFKEINKEPVQVIKPVSRLKVNLEVLDWSHLPEVEQEKRRSQLLIHESSYIFNLEEAPLFRTRLVKWHSQEYDFVFNMHHIISDGWSMEILREEFDLLYEGHKKGETSEPEALKIQYKDYAVWHNRLLVDTERIGKAKAFWKEQLSGTLPVLNLPYDVPPSPSSSKKSAAYCLVIPQNLTHRLRQMGRDHHASLFMVLLTGFNLLLSRVTGKREIVIAIPAAARRHAALRNIIGMFVNTLILRTMINTDETFVDFLKEFKDNAFQVLEYQTFPMELICSELKIKYPEISVFFNMINIGNTNQDMLTSCKSYHIEDVQDAKFDIVCYLREYKNGIEVLCHYFKDLFMPETIEKIMNLYMKVLESISNEPGTKIGEYSFTRKKRMFIR